MSESESESGRERKRVKWEKGEPVGVSIVFKLKVTGDWSPERKNKLIIPSPNPTRP